MRIVRWTVIASLLASSAFAVIAPTQAPPSAPSPADDVQVVVADLDAAPELAAEQATRDDLRPATKDALEDVDPASLDEVRSATTSARSARKCCLYALGYGTLLGRIALGRYPGVLAFSHSGAAPSDPASFVLDHESARRSVLSRAKYPALASLMHEVSP